VTELQAEREDPAAIDALTWCFIDSKALVILDKRKPALAPPFFYGFRIEGSTRIVIKGYKRSFHATWPSNGYFRSYRSHE